MQMARRNRKWRFQRRSIKVGNFPNMQGFSQHTLLIFVALASPEVGAHYEKSHFREHKMAELTDLLYRIVSKGWRDRGDLVGIK